MARLGLRPGESQARQGGLKPCSRVAAEGVGDADAMRRRPASAQFATSRARPALALIRTARATFSRNGGEGSATQGTSPMAPRVLISDKLSPAAVAIFKERGVEVDVKPGLDKDELAKIIGDYDGLAIRSATKVTAKLLEHAHEAEGGRPRRHRRRQRRHSRRDRARRHRHEHAVRQFDHHRRARHRADVRAGAPDPRRRRLDPGRQVGEEPLHGRRDHRQDARHHRLRQHRLDRRLARRSA